MSSRVLAGVLLVVLGCGGAYGERGIAATTANRPEGGEGEGTHLKWAVVVGVGEYEDRSALPSLPNAVRDAMAIHDALLQRGSLFGPERTVLMTDVGVTDEHLPLRDNILREVAAMAEQAGEGDSLFLYFACHGAEYDGELYLMPRDAGRDAEAKTTAVAYGCILEALNRSKARLSLVILDTCHSATGREVRGVDGLLACDSPDDSHRRILVALRGAGGATAVVGGLLGALTEGRAPPQPGEAVDLLFVDHEMIPRMERHSEGRIRLAACKHDEESHEYDRYHGAFTWFLLQGLQGEADANNDGWVTATEVSNYTAWKVPLWAETRRIDQHPVLKAELTGDFVLTKTHAVFLYAAKGPGSGAGTLSTAPEIPRAKPVVRTRVAAGMDFVFVPPGRFMMGSPAGEAGRDTDEGPQYEAAVSRGFYLAKYEVTRQQFSEFVGATGYRTEAEVEGWSYGYDASGKWGKVAGQSWPHPGFAQGSGHPVVCVSWNDAQEYVKWLNRKGEARFRLPTEVEWEYACRAGGTTAYPWGDDAGAGLGCCNAADRTSQKRFGDWDIFEWSDFYMFTAPVGCFRENPWGLCDMIGNVWEWCADGKAAYPTRDGADGERRVMRGGGWSDQPRFCRSANRGSDEPGFRDHYLGFRLAVE